MVGEVVVVGKVVGEVVVMVDKVVVMKRGGGDCGRGVVV